MKIFYSGTCSNDALPEFVIRKKKPYVMMTFFDFYERNSASLKRFKAHRNNRARKTNAKSKS